eukprot:839054-Pleurochrysis_carterae.AAC.2
MQPVLKVRARIPSVHDYMSSSFRIQATLYLMTCDRLPHHCSGVDCGVWHSGNWIGYCPSVGLAPMALWPSAPGLGQGS